MSEPGDLNAQFFEQFIDDYFAEADEHLRSLRRNILVLEDSLSVEGSLPKEVLDELFRSFHTLKGISAMAGVSAAEALAHILESYLRLLREGRSQLTNEGLTALVRGTQKIEEVVNARRENGEIPSIIDETRLLEALAADDGRSTKGAAITDDETAGSGNNRSRYLFTFASAPELAERNVNVNTVRNRLQQIGTIVKSTPTVRAAGQIAFEFVVETDVDESAFETWNEDGIEFERLAVSEENRSEDGDDPRSDETIRASGPASSNVVRVELSRLDELMVMLGELVVSRSRLSDQIRRISNGESGSELLSSLEETNHAIERQLRNLRDGVMRTRMSPIGEVFERLEFAVRDLARETGRKVRLDISGENTEIDKLLVEKLLDPLLHLVRNSVAHGIEPPAERIAKGKPEFGTVRLHASTIGETVVLEVADDGAGIDVEKASARARERGLVDPRAELDNAALIEVLCAPGFSTRDAADKASGRGVGMDVVRRVVEDLGGNISLETRENAGTIFRLQLPLTLAIADALIVAVDKERFAVPQASVNEVIEISQSSVRRLENNEIVDYRGTALPLIRLSQLFSIDGAKRDVFHAFVVGEGKQAVGVAVDKVIGQAEIVVRAMGDSLVQVPGFSGATELGDGRLVLILDVPSITRRLNNSI